MSKEERRCTFIIQRGKRKDRSCNKKGCRWDKDKCLNHWRLENQLMDDINRTIRTFEPELTEQKLVEEEEVCAGTTPFILGPLEESYQQQVEEAPFQPPPTAPPQEDMFSDTEDEAIKRKDFDESAVVSIMHHLRQKRREALGVA